MKTLQVKAGETVEFNGYFCGPGWREDVDEDAVAAMLASGSWSLVSNTGATAAEEEKPEGEALTAAIVDAIDKLDPEKDFAQDGSPMVKPIEVILGYDITAEDRNVAWASLQEAGA